MSLAARMENQERYARLRQKRLAATSAQMLGFAANKKAADAGTDGGGGIVMVIGFTALFLGGVYWFTRPDGSEVRANGY